MTGADQYARSMLTRSGARAVAEIRELSDTITARARAEFADTAR